MTFEEMTTCWQQQSIPNRGPEQLRALVTRENRRQAIRLWASRFFLAFCVLAGIANLIGQRWENGDSWWLVFSRFSVVLIMFPFQWQAERLERRRLAQARALASDIGAWLTNRVNELRGDLRPSWGKPIAFLAIVFSIVCWTKWIDYQNKTDTLAECVAIPLFVAMVFVVIAIGIWHHRTQFLVPELSRLETMLADFESEAS
ncbi:MAG: hypothetical protein AAFX06_26215 [Planctomycetota bacterium]